jgi:ABC-type thiamin/hydroxymethylpyrimidine transport system permease subunit
MSNPVRVLRIATVLISILVSAFVMVLSFAIQNNDILSLFRPDPDFQNIAFIIFLITSILAGIVLGMLASTRWVLVGLGSALAMPLIDGFKMVYYHKYGFWPLILFFDIFFSVPMFAGACIGFLINKHRQTCPREKIQTDKK